MSTIKKILISQPCPIVEKNPFSDISEKHNVCISFHPLVKIECVSLKEFRSQRVEILDHSAIVFTSKTSIDHFFNICEQARTVIPEGMKYFCISEAVALYLQKYIVYRKRKIFYNGTTFDQLVELLGKHKDLKYFYPVTDQHKGELLSKLSKGGVKFSKVVLSHTVLGDLEEVDLNSFDLVALYSQAEANAFASEYKGGGCKVATFGSSTACAALSAGLEVDLAVPTPGIPSIATGIDKYLSAISGGEDLSVFRFKNPNVVADAKKVVKSSPRVAAAK